MEQSDNWVRLSRRPLLITESVAQFDALYDELERDIAPRGFMEKIYARDIAELTWEIIRYRRAKAAIVNTAFRAGLAALLAQLMRKPGDWKRKSDEKAQTLARAWFTSEQAKTEVDRLLARFGLDQSAIEGEVIRKLAPELEMFERILASSEARRNKLLRAIEDYRVSFAQQVRASSDRVIDGQVRRLRPTLNKAPPAA
jgi:hypothetical protein